MSGGVDSSVAAALLKEQGYDVVGIMLRLWSEPPVYDEDGGEIATENKCCSLESVSDARRVADLLDIPFYVVNVEEPFRETIVDYFYDEYAAGRTPNPCLRCNRQIRFTLLLERALALGADYLATGHYVRVDDDPRTGLRRLRRAVDTSKDQSYVLHVLSQWQLQHALFPLGEYTKSEVRAMAAERGLPVATKAESQEICFVAANDYRGFMRRYAGETGKAAPVAGAIVDEAGARLGMHEGMAYYTIGQRKGLGISSTRTEPSRGHKKKNRIAADPQPLALADGVVGQPFVIPSARRLIYDRACHWSRLASLASVASHEAAIVVGGDEADLLALGLGRHRQAALSSHRPHLALGVLAEREERVWSCHCERTCST